VLSGFFLLFSFNTIRHRHIETLTAQLQDSGLTLRTAVVPLLNKNRIDALGALVRDTDKETDLRATVMDTDGVVLADSREGPNRMDTQGAHPEVVEDRSGKKLTKN
jgi:hypothetical protein